MWCRVQDDWLIHYRNSNVSNDTERFFCLLCSVLRSIVPGSSDLSSVRSVYSCLAGLFSDTRTQPTTATRQWS